MPVPWWQAVDREDLEELLWSRTQAPHGCLALWGTGSNSRSVAVSMAAALLEDWGFVVKTLHVQTPWNSRRALEAILKSTQPSAAILPWVTIAGWPDTRLVAEIGVLLEPGRHAFLFPEISPVLSHGDLVPELARLARRLRGVIVASCRAEDVDPSSPDACELLPFTESDVWSALTQPVLRQVPIMERKKVYDLICSASEEGVLRPESVYAGLKLMEREWFQ